MGNSWKLRFHKLEHESKMRLIKIHSHTSANGKATKPAKYVTNNERKA